MSRAQFLPSYSSLRFMMALPLLFSVAGCAADSATDAATKSYIRAAAIGDMFEIESSRLALDRASGSAVRDFAQMMVADHMMMTEKLEEAVDRAGIVADIPSDLDSRRQALLDQLQDAESAAFDQLYINMQRNAHDEALSLHEGYGRGGSVPELRALSKSAVPVIEHHRMSAEALP